MPTAETARPTARDVATRAMVLKYVVAHACIAPPRDWMSTTYSAWSADEQREFSSRVRQEREDFWGGAWTLRRHFSPWEREFAAADVVTMTARQQLDAMWRSEALQVLTWALELI